MLEKVQEMLARDFSGLDLHVKESETRPGIVILSGECNDWKELVRVGQAAAKVEGVVNVVSDMTVKGLEIPKKDYTPFIEAGKKIGVIDECDVVIVGLGIVGCMLARHIAKYDLKVIAVDMGEDVCTAASKANNGGVHQAGAVKPGTLKAKLSVQGNAMYDKLAEELNFEFWRCGSLNAVSTFDPEYMKGIYNTFYTALQNHDVNPVMMDGPATLKIVPRMALDPEPPVASVYLPSQAKTHPYQTCVALIENAADNGVKVIFDCTVGDVIVEDGEVKGIITEKGIIKCRYLINSAGIYGDEISAMAGDRFFTIHNRKGTIAIIDKHKKPKYPFPARYYTPELTKRKNVESKGGGMDITPSMNILLGPSATEVPDKEDIETTKEDLDYTMWRNQNEEVTRADIIRIFAGARPADFKEDFIVDLSPVTHGLITCGAIQSPGVGSSPAVAQMAIGLLKKDMEEHGEELKEKPDWNPYHKKRVVFADLSREEQDALIKERPEYGHIICRCESITEGEIIDAIHTSVPPTTIDAIKRRTRAGMGRCQGGFCQARVLEILARELGKEWVEINLKGRGSNVLKEETRKEAVAE